VQKDKDMSSRDEILGRIRQRLGRGTDHLGNDEFNRSAVEAHVAAHPSGPRPQLSGDLLTRFQEKALALASTVDIVADWPEVTVALARYWATQGLPRRAICWPELAHLDWAAQGIAVEARPVRADDLVGITGCFAAVAETGSLVLCSGETTAAATSLLPETHIAVLASSRLVADMESVWAMLRAERQKLPRAVNFISGPSRTGDIEQTIVLGAHGPYRVHIVVVRSA
jgi:L-lactate dehydrogenase complex protein LldG